MTLATSAPIRNGAPDHLEDALLPWEDKDAFHSHYISYMRAYPAADAALTELVEQLVWISWRRRRLKLAERASHMAAAHSASASSSATRDIAKARALVATDSGRQPQVSSEEVLWKTPDDDIRDGDDIAEDEAMTRKAIAIIETGGPYPDALEALREDTREWWLSEAEDDDLADLGKLKSFLERRVLPDIEEMAEGVKVRDTVRRQIHGESFDPTRLQVLHAVDERLSRQYERVLKLVKTYNQRQRKS